MMFWGFGRFGINKKTVRELRKNQGLTAKELAQMLKIDTIEILKIDALKLGEVKEPLRTKITPVLKGEYMDKVPW